MPLDAAYDEIERHGVFAALRHDDVGVLLRRLHVLFVHGLDGVLPLLHNAAHRAAALFGVAQHAPGKTHVGVGIHKHADVHEIGERRIGEDQYALDQDDRARLDLDGLAAAVVHLEVVHRAMDRAPLLQKAQMLDHHFGLERLGAVVVESGALLVGEIVVRAVVIVVVDDAHLVAEAPDEIGRERRLSAAGAAGNADDENIRQRGAVCFLRHQRVPLS